MVDAGDWTQPDDGDFEDDDDDDDNILEALSFDFAFKSSA